VHRQPVIRRHQLVKPQRRDPENLADRCLHLRCRIVRQPPLEIAQDRILGVATNANDVGKAEFGTIGVVDALERRVFGI
jgi:hypothetical protein